MTLQEYIKERVLPDYATKYGYHRPGDQKCFALPCACKMPICTGWALIRESEVHEHLDDYILEVQKP